MRPLSEHTKHILKQLDKKLDTILLSVSTTFEDNHYSDILPLFDYKALQNCIISFPFDNQFNF